MTKTLYIHHVFNGPGVSGAVLQKTFDVHAFTDPFPPTIQNSITPKRKTSEILGKCSPSTKCHMSGVICHVSCVRCHVSCVTCHSKKNWFQFFYKVFGLVWGGSVINGAYPIYLVYKSNLKVLIKVLQMTLLSQEITWKVIFLNTHPKGPNCIFGLIH